MPEDPRDSATVYSRQVDEFYILSTDSGHGWVGDEPASIGGKSLGPTPFALFVSALAH